jgi:hypothetical protein
VCALFVIHAAVGLLGNTRWEPDDEAKKIAGHLLTGNRLLTKEQVTEFAKFFNVAPAAFLPS